MRKSDCFTCVYCRTEKTSPIEKKYCTYCVQLNSFFLPRQISKTNEKCAVYVPEHTDTYFGV